MSPDGWRPIDAASIANRIASWLDAAAGRVPATPHVVAGVPPVSASGPGTMSVAIDGPPCAEPELFAHALVGPLHELGRAATVVRAESFWRDASLRLEHGREDVDSYAGWLDADALARETLTPFAEGRPFLPSLRDPVTNRSTREPARAVEPGHVLIVAGPLLLGRGLPFTRTVHLHLRADARARRTPPSAAWTLPAFERADAVVRPTETADVTVRLDRRTPAIRGL